MQQEGLAEFLFHFNGFILLYTLYLSSILGSIPFKCSHTAHGWILFHFTHSSSLNCFLTISTVVTASLSSDIFKPSPWGEQKPASIWNQLFCSVHESRTKPWQKNSCKDRCVICFCPSYRLCCYQSIYCAAVLQLWMQRGPEALQHIKAVTNMEQGPNGEKCRGHIWNKPKLLLIRSHFWRLCLCCSDCALQVGAIG